MEIIRAHRAPSLARRKFLRGVAGVAALPFMARRASAEDYPARPVRVLVGQAAGSSSDIIARLISQRLSERLGQQFAVEDRPGAGGNIATEAAVRANADGYTLLLVNSQNAISASLYKLNFEFIRDIAPIAGVSLVPLIMEVNPAVPAKTVPEFIAYAKQNPGKISMASAGIGGPQHVAGELFKMMAGLDMVHVPYRGSTPALVDLLAGQVQLMFDVTPSSLPHVKAGRLRPLGVTTTTRLDVLPDVPPVSDFLPGYQAAGWIGFGAPRGTPPAIVEKLSKEIDDAVADPQIKARLADLGGTVLPKASPAEFGAYIATETDKWAKVVAFAGIKPE
ncbi:MAG: tripartite tricarboxylate transporter substrate binding protein [Hyphomicrobiales bacterium]|nr:tripartite tricarboxylate transporter substrate binding protein [Hyphomicrobiales bacterium]MBV8825261.1 tripartite tricarboxylate transporter substrate binding protein [Hyphomicrobiales bacterium]MBV9429157.1 tripartite tricarboxylate transporter substrate binding protein [Bradyrhizobiaceae bacterium]